MKSCFHLLVLFAFLTWNCQSSSDQKSSSDSIAVAEQPSGPMPVTICIWNELGVRESPGEKGKYLTSVYLGERLKLVGDTASELSGTKRNRYRKVELSDGKQGWVREDLIAMEVFPAAFVSKSNVCKRPDFATVSDKEFEEMEFVAAKHAGNGWVEVIGKRSGDKWFSSGYVKTEALTFEQVDADFAALYKRMFEISDQKMKDALMTQLNNESVFGASRFYQSMFGVTEEDAGEEEDYYEEGEEENSTPPEVHAYLIYDDGTLSDFDVVDYDGTLQNVKTAGENAKASSKTKLVINGSGNCQLTVLNGDDIVIDDIINIEQAAEYEIIDTGCQKITITVMQGGNVVYQGTIPFECE